jgi:hypothetical protein
MLMGSPKLINWKCMKNDIILDSFLTIVQHIHLYMVLQVYKSDFYKLPNLLVLKKENM